MKCTEQNEVIFLDEVYPQMRLPPLETSGGQEQNNFIFSDKVYPQMRCTEPYYTRSFDPLPLPQLNQVVQSPTTPGQFDMWKNADVPRSDVPSPTIEPSGTEPYYTRSV